MKTNKHFIVEYIDELTKLGWNVDEIDVFLNSFGDEKEAGFMFEQSKVFGSELFNKMLEVNLQNTAEHKIDLIKNYFDLNFSKSIDLTNQHNELYDIINNIIINSNIFLNLGEVPTKLQYFVHRTLRKALNDNVISQYNDGIEKMFADGWFIEKSFVITILSFSRYHQIGHAITLNDCNIYDPKFNIKILSKDKKFERIYNMKLKMFLDEIVTKYDGDLTQAGVGVVTNAETYNYGYSVKLGHRLYDINPYNKWGTDYYQYEDDGTKENQLGRKIRLKDMKNCKYKTYLKKYFPDVDYTELKQSVKELLKVYKKSNL